MGLQAKSLQTRSTRSHRAAKTPVEQFMRRPLDLGIQAEALLTFERALNFDPDYLAAHLGRARALAMMQQHQAALQIYQRLMTEPTKLKMDSLTLGRVQDAIAEIERVQASQTTASAKKPRGFRLRSLAHRIHLPKIETRWYWRAIPVLTVAMAAALLGPWMEDEAVRQGFIQASDIQSLREDRDLAVPGDAAFAQEPRLQSPGQGVPASVQFAQSVDLAEAAISGATTLNKAVRPLDGSQRERLVDYIVEQFSSKPGVARAVVQEAVIVGKQLHIDPLLLLAIIAVESRFDPMAQSSKGAKGLMQVHTAVHSARFDPFGGSAAAFDFGANIRIGAQILQEHLSRHGSVDLALKHYVGAARMAHDQGYATKVRKERLKLEQVWAQPLPSPSSTISRR
ncbi:MAG: hypothetical protein EBS75_02595 [Betaproteobacteria bacterium]|nr:hypothetical protein [Betaproteobacteria bacterium]